MKWKEELALALEKLEGSGSLKQIYKYIEDNTPRILSGNWDSSVRNTLEINSSDSEAWNKKDDLFYLVGRKGEGMWGLRSYIEKTEKANDFDAQSEEVLPERIVTEIFRILRDTAMTRKIKNLYRYKCQICDSAMKLKSGVGYAEAHHIIPLGGIHKGPDSYENIIVLCPNHHAEFDYGIIAINPDKMTVEHLDEENGFNGKKINYLSWHRISHTNLTYHYNKIYKSI